MASALKSLPDSRPRTHFDANHEPQLPPLENGDRLDQKTFHARYEAMPHDVRAELIGGIVYMASPMKSAHGRYGTPLIRWLAEYEEATPGTEVFVSATNILGPESEPEPDGCMIRACGSMETLCSGVTESDSWPCCDRGWPRRRTRLSWPSWRAAKCDMRPLVRVHSCR
jgi:Putative restriction endonuclease